MERSAILTQPVSTRDHVEGLPDAPLTLVEYGDYQCPHCGTAYPMVKKLQNALGRKLRFAFRNFPMVKIHPYALIAAEAAEAAALQWKFREMHDLLFERQAHLSAENILLWVEEIGLDRKRWENDIRQGGPAMRIKEDRHSAIRSGVNGTPTFFINGVRYDGLPHYEPMLTALELLTLRSA